MSNNKATNRNAIRESGRWVTTHNFLEVSVDGTLEQRVRTFNEVLYSKYLEISQQR